MPKARKHRTRLQQYGQGTPALVAIVPRKKDWRLLWSEHWYRVPVRTAPEGLEQVKWLAFYQTKAFGDEKWAVNYYAEVAGISRARRIELLPDEPNNARAQDLYYRVEVGELLRLNPPIPSRRWRRIVFIPTTLEKLLQAREINDLYCTSPIEDRLYGAMSHSGLAAERQFFVREQGEGYMLDLALLCRDGSIDVECDGEKYHTGPEKALVDRMRDNALTLAGWRILRFSGKEILSEPDRCLKTVRHLVEKLGGLEDPLQGAGV